MLAEDGLQEMQADSQPSDLFDLALHALYGGSTRVLLRLIQKPLGTLRFFCFLSTGSK